MLEVFTYFKNIILIMLITVPFYVIIRFVICKIKIANIKREVLLLVFIIYMIALTLQAITPKYIIDLNGIEIIEKGNHSVNLIPFKMFYDFYNESIMNGKNRYFIINILGNIIMFIPIGIFLPILFHISYKKVILIGLMYSLFIETMQLMLPRVTDIDDIILNILGVSIGILIYKLVKSKTSINLY